MGEANPGNDLSSCILLQDSEVCLSPTDVLNPRRDQSNEVVVVAEVFAFIFLADCLSVVVRIFLGMRLSRRTSKPIISESGKCDAVVALT